MIREYFITTAGWQYVTQNMSKTIEPNLKEPRKLFLLSALALLFFVTKPALADETNPIATISAYDVTQDTGCTLGVSCLGIGTTVTHYPQQSILPSANLLDYFNFQTQLFTLFFSIVFFFQLLHLIIYLVRRR